MISPLLKLWLTNQVESVKNLHIKIDSTNSQLLQGIIPHTIVSAQNVHYQNLAITSIHLQAQNIHLNIPQILKGQPLKLLHPVVVKLQATADREHLAHCLQAQIVTDTLGYTPKPQNPAETRSVLSQLISKLGPEITIEQLEIDDTGLQVQAQFQINAT